MLMVTGVFRLYHSQNRLIKCTYL